MQAQRTPSRASSVASSTATGASPNNAALLGASIAFGRLKHAQGNTSKVKGSSGPAPATYNGPLSGGNTRSRSPALAERSVAALGNASGGSSNGEGTTTRQGVQTSTGPGISAPLAGSDGNRILSSKQRIKTDRKPAAPPKPRRLSKQYSPDDLKSVSQSESNDLTSIPSTTSLVNLFERQSSVSEARSSTRPASIVIRHSNDLAVQSPKPVRSSGGITSMFQVELDKAQRSIQSPPLERHSTLSSSDSYTSASQDVPDDNTAILNQPREAFSRSAEPRASMDSVIRPTSRSSTSQAITIPSQRPGNSLMRSETLSPSSASGRSIPAQYHMMYPAKRMTPNMTGDQLANALVASSLASSRAPSPRKTMEPPPAPSRRHHHKSALSFSRTPSPAKVGMRHTLRKTDDESSDEEEDEMLHPYGKHKKKRLVRKHPHKHHEGDRKRWREAVTERERKRYEGVWAANKGLHVTLTEGEQRMITRMPDSQQNKDLQEAVAEQVSNIVVRDIWTRSRLPPAVLSMVWDLVDNGRVGRLNKEEFVVGMWLIDQRLKGRKLPVTVSSTVWASVKGLQGIKIKK